MFKRVLVANRGEIALRIIRACREMGIESIQVYSLADQDSLPVQFATESYCIGPARSDLSYLNDDALLTIATKTGCDAVHPGYGFLSEQSEFARRVEELGMTFIGPPSDVIAMVGDKIEARKLMKENGVSIVPGSDGTLSSFLEVETIACEIGYPLLIKAAAGGGGKGMREVHSPALLQKLYEEARMEARAAFGDDRVYVEKLIQRPKHIEFQILADQYGNVIHLGERECSIQRHHQKIIEESPSKVLTSQMRAEMGEQAIMAAKACGYVGAGTVEFIVSENSFYFIEINARLQVEHGVTEMRTGIDLVREQFNIAFGKPLAFNQEDVQFDGHVIEVRINAEDPYQNFRPNPGRVNLVHTPGGPGVRIDSYLYDGCTVSPHYDAMISKVLVYGKTRLNAIRRMRRVLEEYLIAGINTNLGFCYLIMYQKDFINGTYDTAFIDDNMDKILEIGDSIG